MADYGRYGDGETREGRSGRQPRDRDDDRGGWTRVPLDEDRSGGGSFGSSSRDRGGDDDRQRQGWGDDRRDQQFGDPDRDRERERGWGGDRDRERGGSGDDRASERGGSWFGGRGDNRTGEDERGGSWSGDRERGSSRGGDRDRERGGSWFGGDRDGDQERGSSGGWSAREGGRSDTDDQQRGGGYGADDRHEGLPIDETSRLIASNKVEGTAVYSRTGTRLGSIFNFMVDKRSGKVEYAVMSYGGFLGMGTRYYPMPWELLEYDTRLGGYRVDMMERDLERAPSFDRSSEPEFNQGYGDRVRGWYGLKV